MNAMDSLQPKSLIKLVVLCVVLYGVYYIVGKYRYAMRIRKRYTDIPGPPRHWLMGNLIQIGEKLNASDRHPDYSFEEMWNDLGRPSAFLLDFAPVETPFLIVADPTIAEVIVQPSDRFKYSFVKSDTTLALKPLTGKESMLTAEGEVWKSLRKRFNKGFSPAHLHSLSPLVVSKTRIFVDRLKAAAKSGETISLKEYSQDLTTDIITTIAIQKDFGSQSVPDGEGSKTSSGFMTACRKLPGTIYKVGQGIDLVAYFDPIRPIKSWYYERIQNKTLEDLIRKSLKKDREAVDQKSAKAIVQLSLAGMHPTNELINNTRDQIKTFLFAGQDTTATAIQWICWELSKAAHSKNHANYLQKLKEEHDAVFGPGITAPFETLEKPEEAERILGDKLPYTTAFIKEILRMHPPAGSARMSYNLPKGEQPFKVDIDGQVCEVDGLRVYISHWLIHRHPKIWGEDAAEFNPDRWLNEDYIRKLPAGSWRPFERGPRNCIGQELAIMELKVVLCGIAREIEFEKIGNTGRNGEKAIYHKHEVTAVPSDGMIMKTHLRHSK